MTSPEVLSSDSTWFKLSLFEFQILLFFGGSAWLYVFFLLLGFLHAELHSRIMSIPVYERATFWLNLICKVVPVIDQEYENNDVLSVLVFKFHVGSNYVFCYAITSHSKIWVLLSTNPGQISLSGSYANLHGDSKLVVLTSH